MKNIIEIANSLFGVEIPIIFPVNMINQNTGHGSTLSVKIVIPSYCQANCAFCFNKAEEMKKVHNSEIFLKNLQDSLTIIKNNLQKRKITIDITGNEPTFDIPLLLKALQIISFFKKENLVDKVVLTTNGYHLQELDNDGVIDIVNISLHHYMYNERIKIFQTNKIPTDEELITLCNKFTTTAVAVHQNFDEDLEVFTNKFVNFAKNIGFKNARIRTNYMSIKNDHFYNSFKDIPIDSQPGLDKKTLSISGFNVNIYRGIKDLTTCIIGTEVIIDDNGKLYLDYYKRYPVDSEIISCFDKFIFVKPLE